MESLLVIIFAALKSCSPGASKEVRDAFIELTQILRRYVACILAAWRVPSPWSMAEDVVQDLYLRLLTRELAKQYDQNRSRRRSFLLGVLRNVVSEAVRKLKPRRTSPLPVDIVDPTPHPAEALAMREIRDKISAVIGNQRRIFLDALGAKYGIEGQSALPPDLTASARNTLTCRARQALRLDLEELMAL
jgi:DNA-directed RNA polymerase specialized sigma24 family protein